MSKIRLVNLLVNKKLVETRSQAENLIALGEVLVNKKVIKKFDYFVSETSEISITANEHYVSRAGLKLASIAQEFKLNFKDKIVLDVGSSTGGFTDFAIQNGARKVIAVEMGTNQLHPSLRNNDKIQLYERTDIRDFVQSHTIKSLNTYVVLIDVSFVSLKEILPHILLVCNDTTLMVAMFKPQFEVGSNAKHKGVIKNEKLRREIIKDFEVWLKRFFKLIDKSDSKISGAKGNLERFYLLKTIS